MTQEKTCYCGIDLGLKGAIAIVDQDEKLVLIGDMPVYPTIVNKKKRDQYDIIGLKKMFDQTNESEVKLFGFERLRPIPMQSSQTGFSLGFATGMVKALLYDKQYEEIEPRSWQKKMFEGINYEKGQTKIVSLQVASRHFPSHDFKKKDGQADAALMALYLKRKYN